MKRKKIIALLASVVLISSPCLVPMNLWPIEAATMADINQNSVFLKQAYGSNTCTLVSNAMMLRRAAMLRGDSNWASITESSLRPTAWLEGVGLYHSFTYNGMKVSYGNFDGKESTLINLLKQHPEGIEIYDRAKPHAILVTDYTGGIFYCADPSPGTPSGRIPISSASITVAGADNYWYVSSPKLNIEANDTTAPTVGKVTVTQKTKDGYTVSCQVNDNVGIANVLFATWTESGGQDDIIWEKGTVTGNTATYTVKKSDHHNEEGIYHTHVYAEDTSGNKSSAATCDVVFDNTPPVISDVQVIANESGYDVQCAVSDNLGIDRVQFATWTDYNGQDDLPSDWSMNEKNRGVLIDGIASYQVLRIDHNNEGGLYLTHIYAYDLAGNETVYPVEIRLDESSIIPGDVDGDGSVGLKDAQIVLKAALGIERQLTAQQIKAADVDGNGSIELSDAQKVLRMALRILS